MRKSFIAASQYLRHAFGGASHIIGQAFQNKIYSKPSAMSEDYDGAEAAGTIGPLSYMWRMLFPKGLRRFARAESLHSHEIENRKRAEQLRLLDEALEVSTVAAHHCPQIAMPSPDGH